MATPSKKNNSAVRPIDRWETSSGITAATFKTCDPDVVSMLADIVEQGGPISTALDVIGVSEATYRDWVSKAGQGKAPFVHAITVLKKARASYLYNLILDLNMAEGNNYRKYMELLRLRDAINWSGQDGIDTSDLSFDEAYL